MSRKLFLLILTACWTYLALLFAWLLAYLATGDRFGIIALANALAVYLFLPVPLVILVAVFLRRARLLIISGLAVVAFLWLWGNLFWPKPVPAHASDGLLSVMTYNVLGRHENTDPQIEVIRLEDAGIVFIQELNPTLATALERELLDKYPYQVLDPQVGVSGMGVISKFPIRLTEEQLPLDWLGTPQVLVMDWNGRAITLVNFHAISPGNLNIDRFQRQRLYRATQAQALVDLARRSGPLIAAGDANATPLSDPYRIIKGELDDAWSKAGFGLGHTFPGSNIPDSSRPRLGKWSVPMWLVRIDYVFYSDQFNAITARTARFDGVSDHRGVVASLEWTKGK
jgi:endonuclease/exonuclease/phosphatase (EEP) superfamily protein YafD